MPPSTPPRPPRAPGPHDLRAVGRCSRRLALRVAACTLAAGVLAPARAGTGGPPGGVTVRTTRFGTHGLLADLYDGPRLPGGRPRPALLMIHGGGWGAGSRVEFAALARWLAAQGALCALVDYRLTTQGARWPAQAHDVEQAVWALRENAGALGISPHRVVAIGGSAGGLLAAWLGTTDRRDARGTPSRVDGVVSLWGPWDLTEDTGRADARHMVRALVGDGDARDASPLWRIDARSAPALLVHGDADTLVPPGQSVRACAALRAAGVPCRLLLLPGENHGIADPRHLAQALDAIRRFVADLPGP